VKPSANSWHPNFDFKTLTVKNQLLLVYHKWKVSIAHLCLDRPWCGRRVAVVKQILVMMAVVLVGCGEKEDGNTGVVNPNKPSPKAIPEKIIDDPIVEKEIRRQLKKPTGELNRADLEKVTKLVLYENKLTELSKGLEKLTQLEELHLGHNQLTDVRGLEDLTKLWYMNLFDNRLTKLPKGLEKLDQLKTLNLNDNKLTDVKGLEKLAQLTRLYLASNPDLTKAQIAELEKALPNCTIYSNPTK